MIFIELLKTAPPPSYVLYMDLYYGTMMRRKLERLDKLNSNDRHLSLLGLLHLSLHYFRPPCHF